MLLISYHLCPRWNGRLQAQLLSAWWNRYGAGTGDFDLAETAHRFQELFDFFQVAGGFDHEALGGRVDYSRSEDLGFFQYGGAAVLFRADPQQDELPADRWRFGEIGGLQNIDQLVHLLDHLDTELGLHIYHDRHA